MASEEGTDSEHMEGSSELSDAVAGDSQDSGVQEAARSVMRSGNG